MDQTKQGVGRRHFELWDTKELLYVFSLTWLNESSRLVAPLLRICSIAQAVLLFVRDVNISSITYPTNGNLNGSYHGCLLADVLACWCHEYSICSVLYLWFKLSLLITHSLYFKSEIHLFQFPQLQWLNAALVWLLLVFHFSYFVVSFAKFLQSMISSLLL